jgi:hypothetical protein
MANLVDRFYAAVTVLTSHGHIKQRLIDAYVDNLSTTDEDELPRDLRERFGDLNARIHAVSPLNGEGTVCASVRKMSIYEASECAHEILALYADLARRADDLPESMGPGDKADVPPFLVKSAS